MAVQSLNTYKRHSSILASYPVGQTQVLRGTLFLSALIWCQIRVFTTGFTTQQKGNTGLLSLFISEVQHSAVLSCTLENDLAKSDLAEEIHALTGRNTRFNAVSLLHDVGYPNV